MVHTEPLKDPNTARCAGALFFKSMSDYKRQLQNPLWQRKRLEILNRDDFQCQSCFKKDKELHVHHKYYLPGKQAWEYPDQCYETLCYECHEYQTIQVKSRSAELIQTLKESGADAFIFSYLIEAFSEIDKTTLYNCIDVVHQIKFLEKRGFDLFMKINSQYHDELNLFMEEKKLESIVNA